MFIITTLEDVIHIVPSDFDKRSRQVLEDNINQKYANRILHGVGLCISLYDLVSASDGLIDPAGGDGGVNVNGASRSVSDQD